jgi:hypothetical protein
MRATRKPLLRAAFGCFVALCLIFLSCTAALWAQEIRPADQSAINQSAIKMTADSLGTASGSSVACAGKGISGGVCYSVALTCPNVTSVSANVKVLSPTITPIGTVVMTAGGGDASYYEFAPGYGTYIVNNVVAAGFTVAETQFPGVSQNGWLEGPATDGPRSLACLYSTLVEWFTPTSTRRALRSPTARRARAAGRRRSHTRCHTTDSARSTTWSNSTADLRSGVRITDACVREVHRFLLAARAIRAASDQEARLRN